MKSAHLGVFTLTMLNVAAVLSIVNFPAQAEYGYTIVFFITCSALTFFIPSALVSAEIASALPKSGGLYLWGKTAFGPEVGFVTVCMQWFNSLPWYGTVMTFIATTFAYVFQPELANNKLFVYGIILAVTWGCTIVNLFGVELYAKLSSIGVIGGTIFPALLIIVLAVVFLLSGHAPAIPFHTKELFPNLDNINQWMLLAGMMVSLAGIDMTALHITDVNKPQKNYPLAILYSSILIIGISIAGALAIALVVPPKTLNMAAGTGEAFHRLFMVMQVEFLTIPVCLLLCLGAITTVFTWLLGPSRGLWQTAHEGLLPHFFAKVNKNHIPVNILLIQAGLISLLASVVLIMPSIGSAFWVFMALSAQLYMIMYLLMFAAAWQLRRKHPELPRPFKIPGNLWGIGTVCFLGMATALLAMLAGYIPPPAIRALGVKHIILYTGLLIIGTLVVFSLPFLALWRAKKQHKL